MNRRSPTSSSLGPDLRDARLLDNRRFLLPLSKLDGFGTISVDPDELLPVAVGHHYLPVPVPTSFVSAEGWFATFFPTFHFRTLAMLMLCTALRRSHSARASLSWITKDSRGGLLKFACREHMNLAAFPKRSRSASFIVRSRPRSCSRSTELEVKLYTARIIS